MAPVYNGTMLINVLDQGFVRLVDHMGGDEAVVQAARVSFGQESKGEEKDKRLIAYLLKHNHGTPFEMAVFKFHVKAPIFVARQWFRHRIGSYNEISYRYTEVTEEFYVPQELRTQHTENKQASGPPLDNPTGLDLIRTANTNAFHTYQQLLALGVARELARIVLPLSTYTQFYVSYNARALMHFIELRTGQGAQYEISQYAHALHTIFAHCMPVTTTAWDHLTSIR